MRTVELAVAILGCIGMIACVPVVAAKSKAERVGFFVSPMGEPFRISPESDQRPFVTWFASADRNKDGKLDGMEFRADAERFFRSLDVDHDGRIGAIAADHRFSDERSGRRGRSTNGQARSGATEEEAARAGSQAPARTGIVRAAFYPASCGVGGPELELRDQRFRIFQRCRRTFRVFGPRWRWFVHAYGRAARFA